MSFFKKALSAVGIGAAKVNAILDSTAIGPGEVLSGVVQIKGGKAEQSINKIDLDIRCNYFVEEERERKISDDEYETYTEIVERHATLAAFDIKEAFVIQPGEEKEIQFEMTMPLDSPLTLGRSETWLATNLDIDFALDKQDKDYIQVQPNEMQQAVFNALSQLGFSLHDAENEAVRSFHLPFVQELEFKPMAGDFAGRLDELEVIFVNYPDAIEIRMEVDRKARGIGGFFAEMFDLDESKVKVRIAAEDIDNVEEILNQLISEHC